MPAELKNSSVGFFKPFQIEINCIEKIVIRKTSRFVISVQIFAAR